MRAPPAPGNVLSMTAAKRDVRVPDRTPPRWLDRGMELALRTPWLERLVGRSVALVTWTGRRSGRRHTTPVTYCRDDGHVTLVSKPSRLWWRNFAERPQVELRLAGEVRTGHATAGIRGEAGIVRLTAFLERHPRDARAYGVRVGADGRLDERDARALLPQVVVIDVDLD